MQYMIIPAFSKELLNIPRSRKMWPNPEEKLVTTNRSWNVRDDRIGRPGYQNSYNDTFNNLGNTINIKVRESQGNSRHKNRTSQKIHWMKLINLKLQIAEEKISEPENIEIDAVTTEAQRRGKKRLKSIKKTSVFVRK